jgi:glycosyltransferase involved in cell wall biosynthesis
MKVSIALATYNGELYLQEQLDSYLHQSRLPDEVVISDDASTDATLEIIKKFAETAPFEVRWTQNKSNVGFTQNFNRALEQTTGDVVFLSDQDDIWFPEKIEYMIELAQENPSTLLFMNDALVVDSNLNSRNITILGFLTSTGFTDKNFVNGCCIMVRRQLLEITLPIPLNILAHDMWLVSISDGLGYKKFSRLVLQMYRRHNKNLSPFHWNLIKEKTSRFIPHMQRIVAITEFLYTKIFYYKIDNTNHRQHPEILHWISQRMNHPSKLYFEDLRRFQEDLLKEWTVTKFRFEIRALPLHKRFISASRFWWQNGYQEFSGFQSAVRDILIP